MCFIFVLPLKLKKVPKDKKPESHACTSIHLLHHFIFNTITSKLTWLTKIMCLFFKYSSCSLSVIYRIGKKIFCFNVNSVLLLFFWESLRVMLRRLFFDLRLWSFFSDKTLKSTNKYSWAIFFFLFWWCFYPCIFNNTNQLLLIRFQTLTQTFVTFVLTWITASVRSKYYCESYRCS